MKKSLKGFIVIFMLAILIGFSPKVSAETNEESNEVQLNYEMTADNSFKFYISESDNEVGNFLLSGDYWAAFYKGSTKLSKGKKYYLHIKATDLDGAGGFAGTFNLTGSGLKFSNNSKTLITNIDTFKISKTGFGKDYSTPTICSNSYDNRLSPAKWIWTNYGGDTAGDRYLTAEIIPDSPALVATATGNSNVVDLSWTSIENSLSYVVKRSTTQGGPYTEIASDLKTTTYQDKDVTKGQKYYYVIIGKLSDTESVNSNEVSASPLAAAPSALKVVLEIKEELQLSVDDDLAENTKLIWASSDSTVATVDSNGVVTALKTGNTMINVKSADGKYTDHINVLVVEDAKDYRLAVDLKVGKSCRLTMDDATDTVNATWISIDPTVAAVSSKGKVTAVSKGLTLINATDESGNIIGQVYVRVR